MADVRERGIEFPAKSVIESDVGPDLPAILSERVHRGAADGFALSGALGIGIHQTKKVSCVVVAIVGNHGVRTRAADDGRAVNIEIKGLIEMRTADVDAKLHGVATLDPSQAIRPLITISDLRQLTLEVVSDNGAARNGGEWHSLVACA